LFSSENDEKKFLLLTARFLERLIFVSEFFDLKRYFDLGSVDNCFFEAKKERIEENGVLV
jgi:hypothetical protein